MRRVLYPLALGCVASLVALASPGFGAAHADDDNSPGWAAASACLAEHHNLQVQIVVDISRSLNTTDPQDHRKDLVRGWLDQLLAKEAPGSDIEVALGEYGSGWTQTLNWTPLTFDSIGGAYQVVDALTRNDEDTDHVLALSEAASSLATRAADVAQDGTTPCTMMLWFTDGEYDFGSNSTAFRRAHGLPEKTFYSDLPVTRTNRNAIEAQGLDVLCGEQGPVVQMRDQRTALVAVGLAENVDLSLVNEVVTGDAFPDDDPGPGCRLPHYDLSNATTVTDASDLIPTDPQEAPSIVTSPPPPPPPPTTATTTPSNPPSDGTVSSPPPDPCAASKCVAVTTLDIPSLADRADITVSAIAPQGSAGPAPLGTLRVTDPSGATGSLGASSKATTDQIGSHMVGVAPLRTGSVVVHLQGTSDEPIAGRWSLQSTFTTPGSSISLTSRFSSDIHPVVVSPDVVTVGLATSLTIELRDVSDKPISAAAAEHLGLQVTVGSSAHSVPLTGTLDPSARLVVPLGPDVSAGSTGDNLTVLVKTTSDEPVQMSAAQLLIPLSRPEYPTIVFPTARAGVVRPDVFDTPGTVKVPFVVHGPLNDDGCVTAMTTSLVYGHKESAAVVYTAGAKTCLDVGQTSDRELTIRVPSRYEGTICGSLLFTSHSNSIDNDRTVVQAVCFHVERSSDALTIALGILFALLAFLTPVIMVVLNRLNGRLPTPPALTLSRVSVSVAGDGLRGEPQDLLVSSGFDSPPNSSTRELIEADDRVRITAHAARAPGSAGGFLQSVAMVFAGPRTYLTTQCASIIVGSGPDTIFAGVPTGPLRLPMKLDGLWFVVPALAAGDQPAGAPVPARLIVLKVAGPGYSLHELSEDIRSAVRRAGSARQFVSVFDPAANRTIEEA